MGKQVDGYHLMPIGGKGLEQSPEKHQVKHLDVFGVLFPLILFFSQKIQIKTKEVLLAFLHVSCYIMSDSLGLHGLQLARLCLWNSLGRNTTVGCHSLLQGSFPTQGLNPGLLHCRQILYPLSHQGRPFFTGLGFKQVLILFSPSTLNSELKIIFQ